MGNAVACFEIDGVLSPSDSLRDVARLLPRGDQLYARLASYEALLLREKRSGVEPGNRLAYLVPFLLRHEVNDEVLARLETPAPVAEGVREMFAWLRKGSWTVFFVTVAPRRAAEAFAEELGVPPQHAASTTLSLDRLARYLQFHGALDMGVVARLEAELLELDPEDDAAIRRALDGFLAWLSRQPAGGLISAVKPMGGRRKSYAVRSLAHTFGFALGDVAVLGRLPLDRQGPDAGGPLRRSGHALGRLGRPPARGHDVH